MTGQLLLGAHLVAATAGQMTEHRRRRLHAEMYADLHGDGSPSPTAHVVVAGHVPTDEEADSSQTTEPAASSTFTTHNVSFPGMTLTSSTPAAGSFDYGICIGCVVAIVLAQGPTHTPRLLDPPAAATRRAQSLHN